MCPTIVDSLVMELGLKSQDFQQGLVQAQVSIAKTRQSADVAARDMEASGKRAAEFFSQIKTEALSLIGVLAGTAGFGAVIKNAADSMAALSRAAANVGMDPQRLQAWNQVFERNGAGARSFTNTLTNMQAALQALNLHPSPQFLGMMSMIGAQPGEGAESVLMKFMRFVETHPNQPALQNQFAGLLGIPDDFTQAIRQMGSVAEALREFNTELGRSPTKQMTDDAIKLQQAWEDVYHSTVNVFNKVTDTVSGPLTKMLELISQMEDAHPQIAVDIMLTGEAITTLTAIRAVAGFLGLTGLAAAIDTVLPVAAGAGAFVIASDIAAPGPRSPSFGGPSRIPSGEAAANRSAITKQLAGYNYTPAQIAGILESAYDESGFNPRADNGTHYGLFQWDHARQQAFRLWAGKDIRQSTVAEQVAFMEHELQTTHAATGRNLRRAKTYQASGTAFSYGFEVPGANQELNYQLSAQRGSAAGRFVPTPAQMSVVGTPGAGADNSTKIEMNNTTINLPGVTNAAGFASQLPGALTTQANRGLTP